MTQMTCFYCVRARCKNHLFVYFKYLLRFVLYLFFIVVAAAAGIQKWLCERVLKMSASPCSASVAQCTRFLYALVCGECVFLVCLSERGILVCHSRNLHPSHIRAISSVF